MYTLSGAFEARVHPCTLGYMSVAGQQWCPFNCEHIIDNYVHYSTSQLYLYHGFYRVYLICTLNAVLCKEYIKLHSGYKSHTP